MENNYWDKFYLNFNETEPSSFAKWCVYNNKLNLNHSVVDFGCGNGRDTKYISKYCKTILGIDCASIPVIDFNFLKCDVSEYIDKYCCEYDVLYSRFFFHSIEPKIMYDIIKWNKNILLAEFRVQEDVPILFNGHKRYLVDEKKIFNVLSEYYNIEIFSVSRGVSIYKEEDPLVARVFAYKK